jgi:hypothetical protein
MDTTVDFLVWRKRDPISGLEVVDEGDELQYKVAWTVDSLIAPFECDNCVFYRMQSFWPTWTNPGERLLGAYIRQANLDMFWARTKETVRHNVGEFRNQARIGQDLGFAVFDPIGPFDRSYDGGMRAAVGVLMKAPQLPGKHEDKVKFSAARRARSIHTNVYNASARSHRQTLFVRADKI